MPIAIAPIIGKVLPFLLDQLQGPGAPQPPQAGPKAGIEMESTLQPIPTPDPTVSTKINSEIAKANNPIEQIPTPDILDSPKIPTGPDGTEGLDVVEIPGGPPDTKGMSTESKMAMAAQIGSLLRGPGAPSPPGRGGQSINMSPVFQGITMRQLAGR